MAEKLKFWSLKFLVRDGDNMIDISSAAQGQLSTVPCGATQQHSFIQKLHICLIQLYSMVTLLILI